MYFVYFAKSIKNGKVYVGLTQKKPIDRIAEHNSGSNSWTRDNRPLQLIYYESYICKEDAALKEKFYKMGFGHKIKNAIIKTLEQV